MTSTSPYLIIMTITVGRLPSGETLLDLCSFQLKPDQSTSSVQQHEIITSLELALVTSEQKQKTLQEESVLFY